MPREEFEALELTCVNCRGENASDENLLAFMLKRHGVTRKQVAAEYMASRQSGTDVQSDAEGVK
ncbi:hypothetical protein AKJ09_00091 [Labilithrix luteola]|uniref:Uncharacterized protein n=2 Tax=Labilithrix luteola TaxID=1391654 RepID=A0A0K1PIT3_9BACT|nr:hypothetical protein AKJ09_00023 [Labilithrix luteola]AKU93427.1 hypothetical protein AKJ09_00091 [Labilithrix luteola]